MIIIKTFDTLDEWQVGLLPYHHDHCEHIYTGRMERLPEDYMHYLKDVSKKEFVLIVEEDDTDEPL